MTVFVYSYDKDNDKNDVTKVTKVLTMHFEDQRYLENGMWLHLHTQEHKETSIEFDPDYDTFLILQD